MHQCQETQGYKLINGGIAILVISFCLFYYFAWNNYSYELYNNIYNFGYFSGISLLLLGLAVKEKNNKLKHLIYFACSFFFIGLFLTYGLDKLIDPFIKTNKVILSIIITTLLCMIYYSYLYLRQL